MKGANIFPVTVFLLFVHSGLNFADTAILKSGKTIQGNLPKDTGKYAKAVKSPNAAASREESEKLKIQELIETAYKSDDPNLMLSRVSPKFSCTILGGILDYNKYAIFLKQNFQRRAVFINFSFTDIKIRKLELSGNNAVAEVELDWKGFNLEENKDKLGRLNRIIYLAKENGRWEIVSIDIPSYP